MDVARAAVSQFAHASCLIQSCDARVNAARGAAPGPACRIEAVIRCGVGAREEPAAGAARRVEGRAGQYGCALEARHPHRARPRHGRPGRVARDVPACRQP